MNRDWYLPLTGLAFIVLLIVGFIVGGEPPTAGESTAEEIVSFYVDNEGSVLASAIILGLAAIFLVVFAAYLRSVLIAAAGRDILATTALIGATLVVVGLTIDGTIIAGLTQTAEDIEPTAVEALQAFWDHNFMPHFIGLSLFFLSAGFLVIRDRVLPAWLGWVAVALIVVLWVAAIGEIAAAAVISGIGMALWVMIASVMLTVRERRGVGPGTTAPAAGAPPGGPTA